MKHLLMNVLVLLASSICCFSTAGQTHKKIVKHVTKAPAPRAATVPEEFSFGYKDLAVVGDSIWTIATNGKLKLLSSLGDELPLSLSRNASFKSLVYLGHDTLIVTTNNAVSLLNTKNLVWKKLTVLPEKTTFLARDQKQQLYAATDKGIINLTSGKSFLPVYTLNDYYKWKPEIDASFLDSAGILWIGFGRGEWGGNLHAFNTKTQNFESVIFKDSLACLNPVKAFCQVKNQVYMTSSVMHFGIAGCITRLEGFSARHVFNSYDELNYRVVINGEKIGEYIGSLAYNNNKASLYYYSQSGVFEGKLDDDLSKAESWQLLFAPKLHWQSGQRDAVGSPVNVLKMVSTHSGKLVLLTQNDGIGIWDGRVFQLIP
jgi:hypothetical protein